MPDIGEEEEEESESEESPEDYGQELEENHDDELEEDSIDEKNETSGSDEDVFASGDSLINETLDEVILLKPMEYLDYDEVEEDGEEETEIVSSIAESCSESEHGCCAGSKLPAHGPDGYGCCTESAWGCCPDFLSPSPAPMLSFFF